MGSAKTITFSPEWLQRLVKFDDENIQVKQIFARQSNFDEQCLVSPTPVTVKDFSKKQCDRLHEIEKKLEGLSKTKRQKSSLISAYFNDRIWRLMKMEHENVPLKQFNQFDQQEHLQMIDKMTVKRSDVTSAIRVIVVVNLT